MIWDLYQFQLEMNHWNFWKWYEILRFEKHLLQSHFDLWDSYGCWNVLLNFFDFLSLQGVRFHWINKNLRDCWIGKFDPILIGKIWIFLTEHKIILKNLWLQGKKNKIINWIFNFLFWIYSLKRTSHIFLRITSYLLEWNLLG